jgi:hypothetical protein
MWIHVQRSMKAPKSTQNDSKALESTERTQLDSKAISPSEAHLYMSGSLYEAHLNMTVSPFEAKWMFKE